MKKRKENGEAMHSRMHAQEVKAAWEIDRLKEEVVKATTQLGDLEE